MSQKLNAITRFESLLESLVERSFARLFRARLQPVEIAKRLAREMEAGRVVGVSSVLVPNRYEVALSPQDFSSFAPIRASLELEMAQYLLRFAREHNYTTMTRPEVAISSDSELRTGRLEVTGHFTETPSVDHAGTERLEPTRMMPPVNVAPQAPPAPRPGPAYLMLDTTTYPLTTDVVSLGRGLENDIVLEDRRISRGHARLVRSNGLWTVRDENSTNGTFVNGRTVTRHALKNGDRISLGGLELSFHQTREDA